MRRLREVPEWVWIAAILAESAAAVWLGYALLEAVRASA